MKIVFTSDTHGLHHQLQVPMGDVLLHAGDVCMEGTEEEAMEFLRWFSAQPHRYKVFIAGNHDFFFERVSADELKKKIPSNLIYLNDSGITIEGLHIWGSPVQPAFMDWAFNRERGADIRRHWDMIPDGTDILITHGPPYNIFDLTPNGHHRGCEDLREKVFAVKPRYHLFGHMHQQYGIHSEGGVNFINAACLDNNYRMAQPPMVFET